MSLALKLLNTFKKTKEVVKISGRVIKPCESNGTPEFASMYICGPTVYSHSHLGHAITYIRGDLFRRVMKSIFNVRLSTVMNITDIDDKVLARTFAEFPNTKEFSTQPSDHPFNAISDKYYRSFLDDMKSIRVEEPDLCIKVTNAIGLVIKFIQNLERKGFAYVSSTGDVCFQVTNLKSYVGAIDPRKDNDSRSSSKRDARDFVLWKVAKVNEPVWHYKSDVGGNKHIPGRPGWHVQCSAIASALFGKSLDFHYGGKDLIFPHHYNEEACCCAFHDLETNDSLHVWANHWLHAGHLVLGEDKMSKSLGNVVPIKDFIERTSVNSLRLLCIKNHYRADINFNSDLFEKLKMLDHKINAMMSFLDESLYTLHTNLSEWEHDANNEIEQLLKQTSHDVIDGICDDLDFNKGLESILNMGKVLMSRDVTKLKPIEIIRVRAFLVGWCEMFGLDYLETRTTTNGGLVDLINNYRYNVRHWAVQELKSSEDPLLKESLTRLLYECDRVRTELKQLGFVARDQKVK